jgi:putative ABC transport system permease protein
MLKAALRGLLARKLRLALAGLAVALGVLATSAAMVTTATIGSGFDSIFATISSDVDVSVSGKSTVDGTFSSPVPAALVDEVATVPGVADAVGEVSADGARPIGPDGKVISVQGPPRIGRAWHGETGLVRLREGRGPAAADEVAINAGLAFGGAAGAAVVAVAGLAELAIPWPSLGLFLGLSVVAGLLAALAPATRAAKVNVLSAIAHE